MRDESARAWSELDATGRLERLKKITKVDIFGRYPREIIEGLMDACPPQHRDKEGHAEKGWRSIHVEPIRIFHTYVRYSLCFPILNEYAVQTIGNMGFTAEQVRMRGLRLHQDWGDDTVILDEDGEPVALREADVMRILGMRQQNVHATHKRLEDLKSIRVDERLFKPPATCPNPSPKLTDTERKKAVETIYKKTLLQAIRDLLAKVPDEVVRKSLLDRVGAIQMDYKKAQRVIQNQRNEGLEVIRSEASILIEETKRDVPCNTVGRSVERPTDRPVLAPSAPGNTSGQATTENVLELLRRRLGRRLHDEPRPKLCREIVEKMRGAPLVHLDHRITLRFVIITSMGLVKDLAEDVGDAWLAQEELRLQDERAYQEQMERQNREAVADIRARWPSMDPEDREWYAKELPDLVAEAGLTA